LKRTEVYTYFKLNDVKNKFIFPIKAMTSPGKLIEVE